MTFPIATRLTGEQYVKALCLKQPYASWVADGPKTIETRTWQTKFRGAFLVVASLGMDLLREMASGDPLTDIEPKMQPITSYPRGVALATANLVECRPMTKEDEKAACCEFYDDSWAWLLADVKKINPFPVKGQLGFFNVDIHGKLTQQ